MAVSEREEEGELLREATEKGVSNVARYYYHETVYVAGERDDVQDNVQKELDISKATNYFLQSRKAEGSMLPPKPPGTDDATHKGRPTSDITNRKRSSRSINMTLPPKKCTCSSSPTKRDATHNRIRRRVIVRDYGTPIYKASSCAAKSQLLISRQSLSISWPLSDLYIVRALRFENLP
ncbi:hypothetical protein V502_00195 [Pseudogymnoascus sp. VKM F-4520 (FW-2644)]|nr:hypothetical protein V502_00195 [Pseudogymnoascus sp. VKM F-4520 (FW-2644)]